MNIEQLSQFHKLLSEPVRLRILNLLLHHERVCVCDMMSVLDLGQSLVSRHLSHFKHQGLVTITREGTWRFYQLTVPPALEGYFSLLKAQLAADETCQSERALFQQSCCGETQ